MKMPRIQAVLAVVTCAVIGVILLGGGVSSWGAAGVGAAWQVIPFFAGLAFITFAWGTVVMQFWQPRTTVQKIVANSGDGGGRGVTLVASRVRDMSLLAVAGTFALAAGVSIPFAEGGWQVTLIILTVLTTLPALAMVTAVRRPRWLRLNSEGLEASAIRSHARVTWDDLSSTMLPELKYGSGQLILRLHIPQETASYQELWRNPWQLRFKSEVRLGGALDIEFEAMGVDGAALAQLVSALIVDRRLRPHIDWNAEKVAHLLTEPVDSWPDLGEYFTG